MPAHFRDLKRALFTFGISAEPATRGAHWKLRDRSGKAFTLTCHNGDRSEISEVYLRALCRTFGLDLDDLKRRL